MQWNGPILLGDVCSYPLGASLLFSFCALTYRTEIAQSNRSQEKVR